jgi:hypothetical protein
LASYTNLLHPLQSLTTACLVFISNIFKSSSASPFHLLRGCPKHVQKRNKYIISRIVYLIGFICKIVQRWTVNKTYNFYHFHLPTVLKSGSLNLQKPSRPVQASNAIALLVFSVSDYVETILNRPLMFCIII